MPGEWLALLQGSGLEHSETAATVVSLALMLLTAGLMGVFGRPWLRAAEPPLRAQPGPWNTAHLVLVVGVGVVAQWLAGLLLALYSQARGIEPQEMRAGVALLSNAFWQGCLVALLILMARREPRGTPSLGLVPSSWNAVAAGLGVYVLFLPAIFASGVLWSVVLERFGVGDATQAVQELIMRTQGAEIILAAVLAVIVIPFLEEAIFRGWLQGWISHRSTPAVGIVASAGLFAVLHPTAVHLPIFVLAIALGMVRHHTDRLAPVWAMHGLHNGIQLLFLFLQIGGEELPAEATELPGLISPLSGLFL